MDTSPPILKQVLKLVGIDNISDKRSTLGACPVFQTTIQKKPCSLGLWPLCYCVSIIVNSWNPDYKAFRTTFDYPKVLGSTESLYEKGARENV